MKAAAIDIGTNTTRLLITDITTNQVKEKVRTVTRLGENFNGTLQKSAMKRVFETLEKYKKIMDDYDVLHYRGVATSVVRESNNGKEFISEIYKKIGLKIDIIDGKEEAFLTFLGVLSALDERIKNFILLDIGGGSNEFTLVKNRDLIESVSKKFGVVFLYEKFIKHDPPTISEIQKISERIKKEIIQVQDFFEKYNLNNVNFVGTAGTITTLSAIHQGLKKYNPDLINNHVVPKDFLDNLIEEMVKMTNIERFEKYKIEKGREDVILVGLLIVKYTMEVFDFKEIVSIDSSILEGIIYNIQNNIENS